MSTVDLNLAAAENINYDKKSLELASANFIFGRNGSGKSTITHLIREQFGNSFDVHIFDGFESVVDENSRLNSIALGVENSNLQSQINAKEADLLPIKEKISEQGELNIKLDSARKKYANASESVKSILQEIAKDLKVQERPRIAAIDYNITKLKRDIKTPAEELQPVQKKKYIEDLKIDSLPTPKDIHFEDIDISSILARVNKLLVKSVVKNIKLETLDRSPLKRRFAEHGIEIHDKHSNEKCAFCDSDITDSRWRELESYFSKATRELQKEIDDHVIEVKNIEQNLNSSQDIVIEQFYPELQVDAVRLKERLNNYRNELKSLLSEYVAALQKRKENIFDTQSPLEVSKIDGSMQEFDSSYSSLQEKAREYGSRLDKIRTTAADKLRKHGIAEMMQSKGYQHQLELEKIAKSDFDRINEEFNSQSERAAKLESQISDLQSQMLDEDKVANKINYCLKGVGANSFELARSGSKEEGLYHVRNPRTAELRDVTKLSTGEKNVIAFLYFVAKLEDPNASNLPKFIIFDDPVNSNDDIYQYLITSQLDQINTNIKESSSSTSPFHESRLVLLTHNINFYKNALPYGSRNYPKRIRVYNFKKGDTQTKIQRIEDPANNFATTYEALWSDLVFAFDCNRPNLMWNSFRRISGSYLLFNGYSANDVVETEAAEGKLIGQFFKKTMDVNSHELLDFESSNSNASANDLRSYVFDFFQRRGNPDHFYHYWGKFSTAESKS